MVLALVAAVAVHAEKGVAEGCTAIAVSPGNSLASASNQCCFTVLFCTQAPRLTAA